MLAETALNKGDLKTAEHAYVKCKDYYGLDFVKKIQGQAVSIFQTDNCKYFNLFFFLNRIKVLEKQKSLRILVYLMKQSQLTWK